MKPRTRFRLTFPRWFSLCLFGFTLHAAEPAPSAAGYWDGAVALPNGELGIQVELTRGNGSGWKGTIDIPGQGLRGFELGALKVDGSVVSFTLAGIPGEPRFDGKLSPTGDQITGDFAQGAGNTTFKLARKEKPATTAPRDETPDKGIPGRGLPGFWRASLKPLPAMELRLALEFKDEGGKLGGSMISLDQGNARIPVTSASEKEGVVRFETANVGGAFEGKLNADGSEIAGDWSQGGRAMPLVLKRVAKSVTVP